MKITIKNKFCRAAVVGMVLATIGFLSSCKDDAFLLPDRNAMDARIWNEEGAVQFFLNGTYAMIMPDYPYEVSRFNLELASDENILSATDGTMRKFMGLGAQVAVNDVKLIGEKYQGSQKGDNRYFDIARCNLGIHNVPLGSLPDETKRKFLGQFYMLRAMGYFLLVRLYGGVPLVLEPQNPGNLTLSGRASAEDCFAAIVRDLDSAMANLDGLDNWTSDEYGKLTKLAAATYKAKVLLYAASPQFNPLDDPLHPFDQTKWDVALQASKEAYDMCIAEGKALMPYGDIFLTEGPSNSEAIIVRSYSSQLEKRFQNVESKSRPGGDAGGSSNDAYVATTKLLNAYPMADGTPITESDEYDDYFYWKNRDPRFYATIAYNGSIWELNGVEGRKQWTYANAVDGGKPFYCKRFSNPNLGAGSVGISNDRGGNGLDWIELRFAEVLLNYAECMYETGDIAGAKVLMRKLRKERGVLQGANDYGLAFATTKEQMRDLMMNERMVEFAFEGKRGPDLRRTRRMHKLTGYINVFREVTNSELRPDPETGELVAYDLRLQLEEFNPENGLRRRDTLDLESESTLKYFFTREPNGVGNHTNAIAVPERNYFFPLPNTFRLSSPLLEQTIGWENGTFDPLQ